jgi:hypothetical protein
MATTFAETMIKFTADSSGLAKGLAGIEGAITDSTTRMARGVSLAIGGMVASYLSIQKAIESINFAAKAQQAEKSFQLVAESSGIAADALLANLKRAAAGTVDDSEIMQTAVKGMVLGLTDKQLPAIMEAARLAARYAGTDVRTAFEDITEAIGTDMPRALRRYGLITREETAQIQAAISAGAKDIDLYSLAMAHAAVNSAKFGEAQTNAAEKIQQFRVVLNETQETAGKAAISLGVYLTAGSLGLDAFATRAAAAAARLAGHTREADTLMAAADDMLKKRNVLLGIQTDEERKAADVARGAATKKLADAKATLEVEQAKVKAAADWAKTSAAAVKMAEEGIAEYERELKVENQITAEAIKGRELAAEATFTALSTLGQTSLADELAHLTERAQKYWPGTAERIQAEAEAFRFAKDLANQLFEHQKTMGLKSLQQEIDFLKQKAAAAVAGSTERMKAEEDVFKKEEDLRNKRQSAALGILGEAKDWLERTGRGTENVSAADVQMAINAVQQERSMNALRTQGWAAGGGLMSIEDITKGYESAGKLNAANVMQRELGTPENILQGGAEVGTGPVTGSIVGIGSLVTSKWTDAMGTIKTASDEAFGYIEKRAETATSNIATSIYNNLEEWFVRKLQDQAARS